MRLSDFILRSLGCDREECEHVQKMLETEFPSVDFKSSDILSFNISDYGMGKRGKSLCDHIIGIIYGRTIERYVKRGLDEHKFSTYVNSLESNLYYDGVSVDEDKLDKIAKCFAGSK